MNIFPYLGNDFIATKLCEKHWFFILCQQRGSCRCSSIGNLLITAARPLWSFLILAGEASHSIPTYMISIFPIRTVLPWEVLILGMIFQGIIFSNNGRTGCRYLLRVTGLFLECQCAGNALLLLLKLKKDKESGCCITWSCSISDKGIIKPSKGYAADRVNVPQQLCPYIISVIPIILMVRATGQNLGGKRKKETRDNFLAVLFISATKDWWGRDQTHHRSPVKCTPKSIRYVVY